ncbi:MAG: hypothetical protein NT141_03900 [candidate division WWE3 bacterium]|nr:hypothetical protein [candidate division WWE3 bacterium]
MENPINLPFNPNDPTILHLDLNSCFASIEQQANPLLRGRPVAVAAYVSPRGCILAASYEAKKLGVKTGMRVQDGKMLCKDLVVLPPDANKYRAVHLKMRQLLNSYTNLVTPKSIDEFVLDLAGSPSLKLGMAETALNIKRRIKEEVGDYLRVSVGIAPNRYLAKVASSYQKPDGLTVINNSNYAAIYDSLKLTDLCGIKEANAARLNEGGVYTVTQMYAASAATLKLAFHSVCGYQWYLRLHGYEIDDVLFARSSYGNSYALPDKRDCRGCSSS